MKTKTPKIANMESWRCVTCNPHSEFTMTRSELLAHVRETHNIDPETVKGTSTLLSHYDARDYSVSNYEYNFKGVIFQKHSQAARAKDDPMRFV